MGLYQPRRLKSFEPAGLDYLRVNQVVAEAAFVRNEVAQLRGQAGRPGPFSPAVLHPFKLYQLPSMYRQAHDPATDWLRWRVRAGRVLETDAAGTDGIDTDPDSESYPDSAPDIIIPSGIAKFWFWIEIGMDSFGATTAQVFYGDNPKVSRYPADGDALWTSDNPWTSFPVPDANHVPVGWIDTATNAGNKQAVVRQLLRTDLEQVGGGGGGQILCQITVLYGKDYLKLTFWR